MKVNDCNKYFKLCDSMPVSLEFLSDRMGSIFFDYEFFKNLGDVSLDTFLELLMANNAPFFRNERNLIDINTKNIALTDCTFCFVDIETTSCSVDDGQIIEIGALKVRNGEVLGEFESLIYSPFVPEEIENLTGITPRMLEDAPSLKNVMRDFLRFLGDSVFVGHSVSFDYGFISNTIDRYGIAPLLNPRLCTLALSKKAILSQRHGLGHLNAMLGINTPTAHRALADAITSFEVFKICQLALPYSVKSLQDLIDFTRGKIGYPLP